MERVQQEGDRPTLLFVGTGVSTALPNVGHLLGKKTFLPECVCHKARNEDDKNNRNNVSILLTVPNKEGGPCERILVDVGKTFRASCLKVLAPRQIRWFDSLLLTHGHEDAVGGLDDVRDLQDFNKKLEVRQKVKTFLTKETLDVLSRKYDYIIENANAVNGGLKRRVTSLELEVIESTAGYCFSPAEGMEPVRALPVFHGGSYICMGFDFFASTTHRTVYLSDISGVPEDTMKVLCSSHIETLIVDALHKFDCRSSIMLHTSRFEKPLHSSKI
mmetsp:Transcript_6145/g.15104  ORF Transcript_6145/g.15104 Transcript_6145/m.15104 type:complete len:274 (-) Transcript_6145:439-1260(-)